MRYQPRTLWKTGLGVETWFGEDVESGAPVVLKLAPPDPGLWLRLSHEAEILGQLSHPRIPRWLHLERGSERLRLVLEYVPGPTLAEKLASGPLGFEPALELGLSLLEVLGLAHERGVLHRDLKPSNLVLSPSGLAVIDWGLSRSSRLHGPLRDVPVGTAGYLSPEMAGLLRRDVAEPADLYAVGVILYESLTGQPPFQAETLSELMRCHLSQPVPPVPSTLPGALNIVFQRLLAKEPGERYTDAASASRDLESVLKGHPLASASRPRGMGPAPLVGREAELELLRSGCRDGSSELIWLEGSAGIGKTRLLETLALEAAERGALVLRGQGLTQTETLPLQLLAGPFFELSQWMQPELVQRLLPYRDVLVRVSPPLAAYLGPASPASVPEDLWRSRVLVALQALLAALGRPGRPLVLLLDDVQWGDDLSCQFLAHLAGVGLPPHVFLVLASRPNGLPPFLRDLRRVLRLPLAALGPEASGQLVQAVGHELTESGRAWVLELAAGNPFLLLEAVRGLSEQPDSTQVSRRSAAVLADRLERLPPDTLTALESAAVLGGTFSVAVLAAMLGYDPLPALAQGQRHRLIWSSPGALSYSFAHDRLREGLLSRLEADPLAEMSRRAAEATEQVEPGSVFALAHLWRQGMRPERAYEYAQKAARRARELGDFASAADHYRVALEARPDCAETREALGESLWYQGNLGAAAEVVEQALSQATDREHRARLLGWLGRIHHNAGRLSQAAFYQRGALRLQGMTLWGERPVLDELKQVLRELGRTSRPRPQALHTLYELVESLGHGDQPGEARAAALRMLRLSLGRRDLGEAGYVFRAGVYTILGLVSRTRDLAARWSLALLEEVQDCSELVQGKTRIRLALWRVLTRPPRESIPEFERGAEQCYRSGAFWEFFMASWTVALMYYARGDFARLERRGRELYQFADSADMPWGRIMALGIWSMGTGGKLPSDLLELARRWPELTRVRVAATQLELARAPGLIGAGRALEAAQALHDQIHHGASLATQWVYLTGWEATAWRRAAEASSHEWERKALWRKARRAAALAYDSARKFIPAHLPHVLREQGLLAAARGHGHRAEKLLTLSLQQAKALEHDYEAAWTTYEREKLRASLGRPANPEAALGALLAMGAIWHAPPESAQPPTLGLLDRFEQVLEWGRRLVETLDEELVWARLREAGLALLRAEDCLVLTWPELTVLTGTSRPISRSLVRACVEAGRARTANESIADESMLISQARTAMAVPIRAGVRTVCLYASHRLVGQLFEEEERRLAEYLAALAGAAAENSRGLREQECALEALRNEKERVEEVFRAAGVGLAQLNQEGLILQANPALRALLGEKAPEGRPLEDFVALCPGPTFLRDGRSVMLARGRVGDMVVVSLSESSREFWHLAKFLWEEGRQTSALLDDRVLGPLRALVQALAAGDAAAGARLTGALTRDVARIMQDLRNPVLEGQTVMEALRDHLSWFRDETGLWVRGRIPDGSEVSGLTAAFAYRIVQEALANARQANRIEVHLRVTARSLVGQIMGTASGLSGALFRAELLGGTARERPGRLTFRLPLGS